MIKWIKNDVSFARDNRRPIIAKFDNSLCWLALNAGYTTAQFFRQETRELAQYVGAKTVEVKYKYDGDNQLTENRIAYFRRVPVKYGAGFEGMFYQFGWSRCDNYSDEIDIDEVFKIPSGLVVRYYHHGKLEWRGLE